jgi:hypothetical protein
MAATATEPDWSDYRQVLQNHVDRRTVRGIALAWVNYGRLAADPAWKRTLDRLAGFDSRRLTRREETLAFYINAYNILAIKTVVEHWPLASIKDAGNLLWPVWKRAAGVVAGREMALDDIENDLLRGLGEPRIHMAIVCASLSCPDLRPEPYNAARLGPQLAAAGREFLANPGKGLRVEGGAVRVSKIFDWFAGDFQPAGGVRAFIAAHRPDLPPDLPIRADLPYDWSVNGD